MAVPKKCLSDGRPMRAMEGLAKQMQMFKLAGKFDPKTEGIATLIQADDALNRSKIYTAVLDNYWIRTGEYAFYRRDPKAQLGREIVWAEGDAVIKLLVPDVPVMQDKRTISLRNAVGMGVYDSIGLLKIEKKDVNLFEVSPVSEAAVVGKVRAVDVMRGSKWALTDASGLPLAGQPSSDLDAAARYILLRNAFYGKATGWHGSLARNSQTLFRHDLTRDVEACNVWCIASSVALVGLNPVNKQ